MAVHQRKKNQSYHLMLLKHLLSHHFRRQVCMAGLRGGTALAGSGAGRAETPRSGAVPRLSAACYFSWDEESALA